jgi:hypothetical protein
VKGDSGCSGVARGPSTAFIGADPWRARSRPIACLRCPKGSFKIVTERFPTERARRVAGSGVPPYVEPSCIACMFFIMTASAVRSSSLGLNHKISVPGSLFTGTWPGGV